MNVIVGKKYDYIQCYYSFIIKQQHQISVFSVKGKDYPEQLNYRTKIHPNTPLMKIHPGSDTSRYDSYTLGACFCRCFSIEYGTNRNLSTYQNAFHKLRFIMRSIHFHFFFFRASDQYFDL